MNDINRIGELIDSVMEANNWSLRDLERRAADAGHKAAHSTFERARKVPVTALRANTVRVLSQSLGVAESVVIQAALETMGLEFKVATTDLNTVVRQSPELTAHDKRLLLGMIDLMRSDESEQGNDLTNDEHPDPIPFPSHGDAVDDGAVTEQEDEADWAASKTRGPRDLDVFDAEHGDAGEHDQRNHEND